MNKPNHEARAYRAWKELALVAARRETVTYAQLSSAIGVHHRASRYYLEPIQAYCMEKRLPPLTILVVNQTGRPGKGFIAWDVANFDEGLEQVFEYNWDAEPNPFAYAADGTTLEELVDGLVRGTVAPADVYVRVKVRGMIQQAFRQALLRIYGKRCAMCGLSFESALEAAHIKRWGDCDQTERLEVQNGLLLCSNHHRLFDAGVLTLTADWSLRYDSNLEPARTPADQRAAKDLDGVKLRLPADSSHWPDAKYLEARGREPRLLIT